jgi:hypothetical protein
MLIARHQDQTGKGTESVIVTGNGIGMLPKRGLPVEISGNLETGGNVIPRRPMTGTGLCDVTDICELSIFCKI